MKISKEIALVAIVAIVGGIMGGFTGGKLEDKEKPEYEFGTALLEGSMAYPAAHGFATFEAEIEKNERIFKLQLEDVPGLARATLKVLIDATEVGDLKINDRGNGALSIKVRGGEPFPTVDDNSMVQVRTPEGILVASGSLGEGGKIVEAGTGTEITSSGPGYPTGPLAMVIPPTQIMMDEVGQVKQAPGMLEVVGRQYEANGTFPVTINAIDFTANEIKVISNLKFKNGAGQYFGTIDVDINAISEGHLTLEFKGSATTVGSTIASSGTFKTTKTTGMFAGLVAEGTFSMAAVESGANRGSPVTISITTASAIP